MRRSRRRHDLLASSRMEAIYPRGVSGASRTQMEGHAHVQDEGASGAALDPVCGMTVDPRVTPHRAIHLGHTYYFCSNGCRQKFAADPGRYAAEEARTAEPAPPGTIYTCPMHPEI